MHAAKPLSRDTNFYFVLQIVWMGKKKSCHVYNKKRNKQKFFLFLWIKTFISPGVYFRTPGFVWKPFSFSGSAFMPYISNELFLKQWKLNMIEILNVSELTILKFMYVLWIHWYSLQSWFISTDCNDEYVYNIDITLITSDQHWILAFKKMSRIELYL